MRGFSPEAKPLGLSVNFHVVLPPPRLLPSLVAHVRLHIGYLQSTMY